MSVSSTRPSTRERFTHFLNASTMSAISSSDSSSGPPIPGPGLEKFEDFDGVLWREVYRDGDTVIYQVLK